MTFYLTNIHLYLKKSSLDQVSLYFEGQDILLNKILDSNIHSYYGVTINEVLVGDEFRGNCLGVDFEIDPDIDIIANFVQHKYNNSNLPPWKDYPHDLTLSRILTSDIGITLYLTQLKKKII